MAWVRKSAQSLSGSRISYGLAELPPRYKETRRTVQVWTGCAARSTVPASQDATELSQGMSEPTSSRAGVASAASRVEPHFHVHVTTHRALYSNHRHRYGRAPISWKGRAKEDCASLGYVAGVVAQSCCV